MYIHTCEYPLLYILIGKNLVPVPKSYKQMVINYLFGIPNVPPLKFLFHA